MGSVLSVNIFVRAASVSKIRRSIAAMPGGGSHFSKYCVWKGRAVHPGCSHRKLLPANGPLANGGVMGRAPSNSLVDFGLTGAIPKSSKGLSDLKADLADTLVASWTLSRMSDKTGKDSSPRGLRSGGKFDPVFGTAEFPNSDRADDRAEILWNISESAHSCSLDRGPIVSVMHRWHRTCWQEIQLITSAVLLDSRSLQWH